MSLHALCGHLALIPSTRREKWFLLLLLAVSPPPFPSGSLPLWCREALLMSETEKKRQRARRMTGGMHSKRIVNVALALSQPNMDVLHWGWLGCGCGDGPYCATAAIPELTLLALALCLRPVDPLKEPFWESLKEPTMEMALLPDITSSSAWLPPVDCFIGLGGPDNDGP
jgi:hypothetical protein